MPETLRVFQLPHSWQSLHKQQIKQEFQSLANSSMSRTVKEWKNFCPDAACLLKDWNCLCQDVKLHRRAHRRVCGEAQSSSCTKITEFVLCTQKICCSPTPVPSPYRKMKAHRKTGQDTEAALAGLCLPDFTPQTHLCLLLTLLGKKSHPRDGWESSTQSHCLKPCPRV